MGENRFVSADVGSFHAHLPVRIAFGDGAIRELADALYALAAGGALVVVGRT